MFFWQDFGQLDGGAGLFWFTLCSSIPPSATKVVFRRPYYFQGIQVSIAIFRGHHLPIALGGLLPKNVPGRYRLGQCRAIFGWSFWFDDAHRLGLGPLCSRTIEHHDGRLCGSMGGSASGKPTEETPKRLPEAEHIFLGKTELNIGFQRPKNHQFFGGCMLIFGGVVFLIQQDGLNNCCRLLVFLWNDSFYGHFSRALFLTMSHLNLSVVDIQIISTSLFHVSTIPRFSG